MRNYSRLLAATKKRHRHLTVAFTLCVCVDAASASCWEDVGGRYGIDPLLLKAIAWKESRGHTAAIGPQLAKGHRALGALQINTIHLPKLARFGIQEADLFDACTSQEVGAWVLANCIQQFGATWKSVGCYYTGPKSSNVAAQRAYVHDVQRYYQGYQRLAQRAAARLPIANQ